MRSRGTTFIRLCFNHRPRLQNIDDVPCNSPLTEASRQSFTLVIYDDFFSQHQGSFSQGSHTSFPPTARSLNAPTHRYSSLHSFSLFSC